MLIERLKNRLVLVYIALWVAISAIHFFILYGAYGIGPVSAAADSLVFNVLFAFLGSGLWFMVRYSDLQTRKFGELAFFHLSGASVTILVWLASGYFILRNVLNGDATYLNFLADTLTVRAITGIMFYALLVSIYYLLINYRELKEKIEKEAKLTGLLKEAELNLLRSQIRPHFLFNSLNSINSLTMTDPARAQEMVIKLSEFMRYTLNLPDTMMSTLEKELHHVELYLDIEKVRFGDRLVFSENIGPGSLEWKVPVMILQPLIENAVKYGVYESAGPTVVELGSRIDEDMLEVKVGNSFDPDARVKKGTGTGLPNIRARLLNLYGTSTLLRIDRQMNYFEVTLRIPKNAR